MLGLQPAGHALTFQNGASTEQMSNLYTPQTEFTVATCTCLGYPA